MAWSRLADYQRDKIRNAILTDTFDGRRKELVKREAALAANVLIDRYGKDCFERFAAIPEGWLPTVNQLNEDEARALETLVGYGVDPFLRVFYKELGKAYLEPHEAGLRTLFAAVRDDLPMILERARKARVVFTGRREHTSDDRLIAAAWK